MIWALLVLVVMVLVLLYAVWCLGFWCHQLQDDVDGLRETIAHNIPPYEDWRASLERNKDGGRPW